MSLLLCVSECVVNVSQWRDDGLQSRVLGPVQTQQRVHQPQLPLTGQRGAVTMRLLSGSPPADFHPSFLFLLLLQLVPLSPFSLTGDRLDQKRQVRTDRVQTSSSSTTSLKQKPPRHARTGWKWTRKCGENHKTPDQFKLNPDERVQSESRSDGSVWIQIRWFSLNPDQIVQTKSRSEYLFEFKETWMLVCVVQVLSAGASLPEVFFVIFKEEMKFCCCALSWWSERWSQWWLQNNDAICV